MLLYPKSLHAGDWILADGHVQQITKIDRDTLTHAWLLYTERGTLCVPGECFVALVLYGMEEIDFANFLADVA